MRRSACVGQVVHPLLPNPGAPRPSPLLPAVVAHRFFRRALCLPRPGVLLLPRLVARLFVRRATADLPLLGFVFFYSDPLDAVDTLAALAGFRDFASATIARQPPRFSGGPARLVAFTAMRVAAAAVTTAATVTERHCGIM